MDRSEDGKTVSGPEWRARWGQHRRLRRWLHRGGIMAARFFRQDRTGRRTATTTAETTTMTVATTTVGNGRIWAETATVAGGAPVAPPTLVLPLSTGR